MYAAYTAVAGMGPPTATELGTGLIGGMTLTPGIYKWSSPVDITADLTLAPSESGS